MTIPEHFDIAECSVAANVWARTDERAGSPSLTIFSDDSRDAPYDDDISRRRGQLAAVDPLFDSGDIRQRPLGSYGANVPQAQLSHVETEPDAPSDIVPNRRSAATVPPPCQPYPDRPSTSSFGTPTASAAYQPPYVPLHRTLADHPRFRLPYETPCDTSYYPCYKPPSDFHPGLASEPILSLDAPLALAPRARSELERERMMRLNALGSRTPEMVSIFTVRPNLSQTFSPGETGRHLHTRGLASSSDLFGGKSGPEDDRYGRHSTDFSLWSPSEAWTHGLQTYAVSSR